MLPRLLPALIAAAWLTYGGSGAWADEAPSAPAAAIAPAAPAAAAAAPTASASMPEGAAVILVGPARTSGAVELARAAYRSAWLRPRVSETEARTLAGGSPGDDAVLVALEALRAAIPVDVDSPEAAPALEALASRTGVRALILFVPSPTSEGGTVRIAHVAASAPSAPAGVRVRLDAAAIVARPKAAAPPEGPAPEGGAPPSAPDWADVVLSIERLVGPPVPRVAAPNAGPLRANLPGPKPHGPPEEPEEEESIFESPWFWITAGTVAAAGLTILIVSQTTDVNTGTIALKGKVLR